MNKTDVIRHYGSITAMAKAIGISRQSIYEWPELIPEQWAWTIEGKTGGAMRVNPRLYESTTQ